MSIKKQFHGLSIRNAIKASNHDKSWLNKLYMSTFSGQKQCGAGCIATDAAYI